MALELKPRGRICRRAVSCPLVVRVMALALAGLMCAISCSDDGDKDLGPVVVDMFGYVDFPAGDAVDLDEVTVGFGEHEVAPDGDGTFIMEGNQGVPGLAMAYSGDSIPLLMCIVPDPQGELAFGLTAGSTALALAFLNPFVCVDDPDDAQEVLGVLEGLPELADLEDLLDEKLEADLEALGKSDPDIDQAVSDVVLAYINSYPPAMARNYPSADMYVDRPPSTGSAAAPAPSGTPEVVVDPGYPVSGHHLTHIQDDRFNINNARGRWAYCITPVDSFYLFPNGTLLDALKGSLWAPSNREFNLSLTPNGDTLEVNVFGAGFSSEAGNTFSALTPREQYYVVFAGEATVICEFLPQVISVITNGTKYTTWHEMGEGPVIDVLKYVIKIPRVFDRMREYYLAGDWLGAIWFMTKEGTSLIVTDDTFRNKFLTMVGMSLTAEALGRLSMWIVAPVKAVFLCDNVTSVMKTTYGFTSTRFKTTFQVWSEMIVIEVGNISGSVHDKDSGVPIEGAVVDVQGDDANPLHPSHQDITGGTGAFYFDNIMTGEKTLRVTKTGYKTKAVDVTVVKDDTINETIELEKETGSATGNIIDEILLEHGEADPRFKKDCSVTARELGGEHRVFYYTISDGDYHLNIPPGTYRIIAEHDDYFPDSVEVVVTADSGSPAPRDLLMKPKASISGDIYLDMDNNGNYETHYAISFTSAGVGWETPAGDCPGSGSPFSVIIGAGTRSGGGTQDILQIVINPNMVDGPGYFALGSGIEATCPGYNVAGGVFYQTTRVLCTYESYTYQMDFMITERSEPACNCGVTNFGSLVLEEYGEALTDVVSGGIVSDLAGWNTCECWCCEDTDDDGQEDDYVVSCAKAHVDVDFRFLVGSLYKVTTVAAQQLTIDR
jgi:hypothetical protein